MSQPGFWIALFVTAGWMLSAGPAAAQRSSILSRPQVSRVVDALESDSERLSEDVELFLDRARRWRPVGADADFWNEVRALEDGADLLQNAHRLGVSTGIERYVRDLLEHGAALERGLDRVRPSRTVRSDWQQVRRGLVNLAPSFGYDYERDILRSRSRGFPGQRERSSPPTSDRDPYGARQSVAPSSQRRYSASDQRSVGDALDRIYDLSEQLTLGLQSAGYSDSDSPLQNLGESLLRGAVRRSGAQDPRRAQLEAAAESIRAASRDAAATYHRARSVAETRASAVSLLHMGSNLNEAMRLSPPGRRVTRTWGALETELNRLARVYELTALR